LIETLSNPNNAEYSSNRFIALSKLQIMLEFGLHEINLHCQLPPSCFAPAMANLNFYSLKNVRFIMNIY